MTRDERKKAALKLYETEPAPTQTGETAGSRSAEGVYFRDEMTTLLACDGVSVVTSLGKSTGKQKLDGNACERIVYKILRFKRNPLNADRLLVVALNAAFERYESAQATELREQVGYLNGVDRRAPVIILSRPDQYEEYIDSRF